MAINLNASANNTAVSPIFSFTPLKNDSTTFFELRAPAYLNAFIANTTLGSIPIAPPTKVDLA